MYSTNNVFTNNNAVTNSGQGQYLWNYELCLPTIMLSQTADCM